MYNNRTLVQGFDTALGLSSLRHRFELVETIEIKPTQPKGV